MSIPRFVTILTMVSAALVLTACGSPGGSNTPPPPPQAAMEFQFTLQPEHTDGNATIYRS